MAVGDKWLMAHLGHFAAHKWWLGHLAAKADPLEAAKLLLGHVAIRGSLCRRCQMFVGTFGCEGEK